MRISSSLVDQDELRALLPAADAVETEFRWTDALPALGMVFMEIESKERDNPAFGE
jgi:hypothetical protein